MYLLNEGILTSLHTEDIVYAMSSAGVVTAYGARGVRLLKGFALVNACTLAPNGLQHIQYSVG